MSIPLLWTSTQFQNWKADCMKYLAAQQVFELRDVYRPEQETFCIDHCEKHHYSCVIQNHTVSCTPPDVVVAAV